MVDWNDRLSAPIQAVEHGIDASDTHFASEHTGPVTFDRIDYPAAQTVVEDVTRTGATGWTHTIQANLYFEWSRDTDLHDDIMHSVASVLDESLSALATTEHITNYVPESINFYSGEPGNNLLFAIQIRFRATSMLDPADF